MRTVPAPTITASACVRRWWNSWRSSSVERPFVRQSIVALPSRLETMLRTRYGRPAVARSPSRRPEASWGGRLASRRRCQADLTDDGCQASLTRVRRTQRAEELFYPELGEERMYETMNNWTVQLIGMFGIAAAVVAVFLGPRGVRAAL